MNLFEQQSNEFQGRHIGTLGSEAAMLEVIGEKSVDALVDKTVPEAIRLQAPLNVPDALSEAALLQHLHELSQKMRYSKATLVRAITIRIHRV